MRIAIGCPVSARGWILRAWFAFVLQACHLAELEPVFVFAVSPQDRDSRVVLEQAARKHMVLVVDTDEEPRADVRDWGKPSRIAHLAAIRNELLGAVRKIEPEWFLSLDSDVLLHPWWLATVWRAEHHLRFDALGGKCYMTRKGDSCPSWAMLGREGGLRRQEAIGCFPVDVIMAIKLMSPAAYAVDYKPHPQGEDIGWAINARAAGLKLGWYGDIASKHVMKPDLLEPVDERVGY